MIEQKACFKDIVFFVDSVTETVEWLSNSHTFITNHKASTERIAKSPSEFMLSGYFLGRSALYDKTLLERVLDESKPGELILPSYGKRMALCVSKTFELFGDSYKFNLVFKETSDVKDILKKESEKMEIKTQSLSLIDKVNAGLLSVEDLALSFTKKLRALHEAQYVIDRGLILLRFLDAAFSSQNGLLALADLSAFFVFFKKKVREKSTSDLSRDLGELNKNLALNPVSFNYFVLVVIELKTRDSLTSFHSRSLQVLMEDAEDTLIFSFLWQCLVDLPKPSKAIKKESQKEPSLVKSYSLFNDLSHEKELSHDAGQPFAV